MHHLIAMEKEIMILRASTFNIQGVSGFSTSKNNYSVLAIPINYTQKCCVKEIQCVKVFFLFII